VGNRVLIADDDRAVLDRVREGLSRMGYEFLTAHDGPGALTAVRAHRPDLVIMDVEMPGLSGVEVCRIVKAHAGEEQFGFVPIILMTARQGPGKVEGLELGADDYLIKPFDMAELSARAKSMLRMKALQDALMAKNRELDLANRALEQHRQELLALSQTDALTGLYNRRYLEERLRAELARADRYNNPLSCAMIDVDHFKQLNDAHGHPFGDMALRQVAQAARATLRDVDLLARYGGEEFLALFPETGSDEAVRAAERVRRRVEALRLAPPDSQVEVRLTVSLGVATFPTLGIEGSDGLLRAADESLYAAKAAGRNRVIRYKGA